MGSNVRADVLDGLILQPSRSAISSPRGMWPSIIRFSWSSSDCGTFAPCKRGLLCEEHFTSTYLDALGQLVRRRLPAWFVLQPSLLPGRVRLFRRGSKTFCGVKRARSRSEWQSERETGESLRLPRVLVPQGEGAQLPKATRHS
mmetsp:Transcript_8916/g.54822  ORF Transcript_8916/g.54822 Transcript_8916/m.54822 type:complete len:144 (+) Transcript_8916:1808-2239(+)